MRRVANGALAALILSGSLSALSPPASAQSLSFSNRNSYVDPYYPYGVYDYSPRYGYGYYWSGNRYGPEIRDRDYERYRGRYAHGVPFAYWNGYRWLYY